MYQGCKKYIPFTPVSLPDRTWPNTVSYTHLTLPTNSRV